MNASPPPALRRRTWQMRPPRADRGRAHAPLRGARQPRRAARRRAAPDGQGDRAPSHGPQHAAAPAMPEAVLDGASRATPGSRRESPRKLSHDFRRPRACLTELAGIADARRCEMRTPAALTPRRRGDGIRDVPGFDSFGDQIISDGHVDAGPVARCEQHGNSALMLGTEAVHERGDLTAVFESGFADMQLDVANLLDRSLLRAPCSPFEQLSDPFLEPLVLLKHRFDAAGKVLGLRLQQPRRGSKPVL